MTSLLKIEKIIAQENYKLAINILQAKVNEDTKNDLYYFLLGKCYQSEKKYQEAFNNFQKAVNLAPYGVYKNEIYSLILNQLAISGLVNTGRKKVVIDLNDPLAVHSRATYPIADTYMQDNINPEIKPDYYIVTNWLSPAHPLNQKLDKIDYPVVSMIVDRLTYAEEHLKANLVYSDVIMAMEDYGVNIYKSFGFENVIYVPGAGSIGFDPQSYPKLNLEKIYDVLFIGNINSPYVYKTRNKILKKLDSLKDKYNILITDTGDFEHYWTLMNQAKIIIDVTIDSQALNYRMFQAMGIEALCFAEDDNPMVTELYQDKENIVLYNFGNLDFLIDYYLNNDDEYNRIAKNGYIKTINNYTHYHFMKMVIDKLTYPLPLSRGVKQKADLLPETNSLYKGITKFYQHKYNEAAEIFLELEQTAEVKNNYFVQQLKLFENNRNIDSKSIVDSYFKDNSDNFVISFNYINYLFYIEKDYISCYQLIEKNINVEINQIKGLYYLPDREEKIIEYFKYKHGRIIFSNGLESEEYQHKYFKMLVEHLYRLKAYIEINRNDYLKAKVNFDNCLNLGSENVWDFFELAKIEKTLNNPEKFQIYKDYCQKTLPFETNFLYL